MGKETSFAHMTRMVTEAKTRGIAMWIAENVNVQRRYELPSNRCWWCGEDEAQSRHHLFVRCKA